jgi:enoyl-CoA hydratase/carnithine racemase
MRRVPQPIVCRIQGYAYGAGFNLALGADFRIMASDARLARPSSSGPGLGTNLLQQYAGIGKAIEMTLLGEPSTPEALRLGLVTRVDAAELTRPPTAGRPPGQRPNRNHRLTRPPSVEAGMDRRRGLASGLGSGPGVIWRTTPRACGLRRSGLGVHGR